MALSTQVREDILRIRCKDPAVARAFRAYVAKRGYKRAEEAIRDLLMEKGAFEKKTY